MSIDRRFARWMSVILLTILALPGGGLAQESGEAPAKAFSQEQLDQLLAPIALYPDSLLTQILMASTYPLEVVKANNWLKQNSNLKGDALAKELEKQEWDPSVKSLVNFPQVLQSMTDKLDWTQKLGDAFLAQQKDVLATVQSLRQKAYESGNLKSGKEQTVTVEKQTQVIVIESANPEVVYVPAYNPTVVYGVWAYPAYPPYYVSPPGAAAYSFLGGVALGAAWGYAWGHSDWHGGDVDVDVNRNTNRNRNIDRGRYAEQYRGRGQAGSSGGGRWQHDSRHRQGVAYRDKATARKYGQGTARTTPAGSGARGYGDRAAGAGRAETMDRSGRAGGAGRAETMDRSARAGAGRTGSSDGRGRDGAFSGSGNSSFDRSASQRGSASRGGGDSYRGGGGSRGGGGRGGGGRGGGRR